MFVTKEPTLTPEDSKKLAKIMEHMLDTSDAIIKGISCRTLVFGSKTKHKTEVYFI